MKKNRFIEGNVLKIQCQKTKKNFYDFEFFGETDMVTIGLVCLTSIERPKELIIGEMKDIELMETDYKKALESYRIRVNSNLNRNDLVFAEIFYYEENNDSYSNIFKIFRKSYKEPSPVYKSIYHTSGIAKIVDKLSTKSFKDLGGKIFLLNNLELRE